MAKVIEVDHVGYAVTASVNNGGFAPVPAKDSHGVYLEMPIDRSSQNVTFKNTWDPITLKVEKEAIGAPANAEFTFKLTPKFNSVEYLEIPEDPNKSVTGYTGPTYEVDNVNTGVVTFTLKNGEFIEIPGLPRGLEILLEEPNATADGYRVTMKEVVGGNPGAELTMPRTMTENLHIRVVNDKTDVFLPKTGGMSPYLYTLGGLAIMAGTAFVYSYRRRRRERRFEV